MKQGRKALRVIILAALAISILTGCGKEASLSADTYKTMAQDFLDQGKQDEAIAVLETGIKETGDAQLISLLAELNGVEVPEKSDSDSEYSKYVGIWAEKGLDWDYGGVIVEIALSGNDMDIKLQMTGSAPTSRVAEIYKTISTDEIVNDAVRFEFEDDGWGNKGTIELKFNHSNVHYEISNVEYVGDEGLAIWGISEAANNLELNPSAYELLEYTMDDYDEKYSDMPSDPSPDTVPNYDTSNNTSNASGILASLGTSEAAFKANCTPLEDMPFIDDMMLYPSNYMNSWFYSYETFYIKDVSADGYQLYATKSSLKNPILVYDLRDDVYSPTITTGTQYNLYMIFRGIQTDTFGDDYLTFHLISAEAGKYNPPALEPPTYLATNYLADLNLSEDDFMSRCTPMQAEVDMSGSYVIAKEIDGIIEHFLERIDNPSDHLGECYNYKFNTGKSKHFDASGYRFYESNIFDRKDPNGLGNVPKLPMIIVDYRNSTYPTNVASTENVMVDGYMTFVGVTNYKDYGIAYNHGSGGDNQEYIYHNGKTMDTHNDNIVLVFHLLAGENY